MQCERRNRLPGNDASTTRHFVEKLICLLPIDSSAQVKRGSTRTGQERPRIKLQATQKHALSHRIRAQSHGRAERKRSLPSSLGQRRRSCCSPGSVLSMIRSRAATWMRCKGTCAVVATQVVCRRKRAADPIMRSKDPTLSFCRPAQIRCTGSRQKGSAQCHMPHNSWLASCPSDLLWALIVDRCSYCTTWTGP